MSFDKQNEFITEIDENEIKSQENEVEETEEVISLRVKTGVRAGGREPVIC